MIDERVRCNECGVSTCNNYDNLNFAKGCKLFVGMKDFKTPMLVHLMVDRKADKTKEVLEKFGFVIEEWGTYPYFKLLEG